MLVRNAITNALIPVTSWDNLYNAHNTDLYRYCVDRLLIPTDHPENPHGAYEWIVTIHNGYVREKLHERENVTVTAAHMDVAIVLALNRVAFIKRIKSMTVCHVSMCISGTESIKAF